MRCRLIISPPIAIIGRGCVLPGGVDGGGAVAPRAGRWQRHQRRPGGIRATPKQDHLSTAQPRDPDTCWTDRGGYIDGFDDVFDPADYLLSPDQLAQTERPTRWLYTRHATPSRL
ncbi:MAG: hypothetical protein AAYR33_05980 [Acetobacteraceae bacterium]